jgi:hypothetical protein
MAALSKLEPDWWLELDRTYVERINQRQQLCNEYNADII